MAYPKRIKRISIIMAKSLSKVHKKINKKKGAVEALHENSRDSLKLRRAGARDDRIARVTHATARGRELYGKG